MIPNAIKPRIRRIPNTYQTLSTNLQNPIKFIKWNQISKDVWERFDERLDGVETKHEKKEIMEEYGRIRAWFGNKDDNKLRNSIEIKLNKVID